jgi:hypothetical protein
MSMSKRVTLVVVGFALALLMLGLLLVFVPPLLVPDGTIDASDRARLVSEAALRSTTLQVIAGLVVVAGIVYTAAQFGISRETHFTDRYTKAIDQLGHDQPVVRLGAIFALKRLALNSSTDRPAVMNVLSGYLRTTAPLPEAVGIPPASTEKPRLAPDIQAALTALIALHGDAA